MPRTQGQFLLFLVMDCHWYRSLDPYGDMSAEISILRCACFLSHVNKPDVYSPTRGLIEMLTEFIWVALWLDIFLMVGHLCFTIFKSFPVIFLMSFEIEIYEVWRVAAFTVDVGRPEGSRNSGRLAYLCWLVHIFLGEKNTKRVG